MDSKLNVHAVLWFVVKYVTRCRVGYTRAKAVHS